MMPEVAVKQAGDTARVYCKPNNFNHITASLTIGSQTDRIFIVTYRTIYYYLVASFTSCFTTVDLRVPYQTSRVPTVAPRDFGRMGGGVDVIPLPLPATATSHPTYCNELGRVVRRVQYPVVKHILGMGLRE